ncbi:MAG: glycosyltransferase family 1 protein [Betaproteobacteria bacterium]
MKMALITDAWLPQVNGVVTTLVELQRELTQLGHEVHVIEPTQFRTRPCPGYAGIDLAIRPKRALWAMLDQLQPEVIHIATEGPLGWVARSYCLKHGLAFTTAFHTKFPEIVNAAIRVPLSWGYALFRHFHRPSSGVMVPTDGVLRMLRERGFANLRPWTHGVDTELFGFRSSAHLHAPAGELARPVSLFVGRVSYEKNIEAFLRLDVPGTKVVCGVGPLEQSLKARYPQVRWLGILPRDQLASVYAAADVFVFPSHADTFGLVLLEAMACGTPVAAYPVDGPREVLGQDNPLTMGGASGGALHDNLELAFHAALATPRAHARSRAMCFSWEQAAHGFLGHLVSARVPGATPVGSNPELVTPLT